MTEVRKVAGALKGGRLVTLASAAAVLVGGVLALASVSFGQTGADARASANPASAAGAAALAPHAGVRADFDPSAGRAFLDQNCVACHNDRSKAGDLSLTAVDLTNIGAKSSLWETVARRVRGGEMPPAAVRRRPDPTQVAGFTGWLITNLDRYAVSNPDPGRPVMRRLNRAEYSNAVRDLLALDINAGELLPADTAINGFTNNGAALTTSPLLVEKYLSAARQVTRQAVGDPTLPRTIYDFPVPDDQTAWLPGLPFGARGGVSVEHYFPIAGEYIIRAITDRPSKLPAAENRRMFEVRARIPAGSHPVVLTVGEELGLAEGLVPNIRSEGALPTPGVVDPLMSLGHLPMLDFRVAGKRLASLKVDPPTLGDLGTQNGLFPGQTYVNRVEVDGPFNPAGAGETASRKIIFTCQPKSQSEEAACARKILTPIIRRAFRRDVAASEVQPFMTAFTRARAQGDFERGIQEALQAVLVAPDFMFRVEYDPKGAKPGSIYRIDDYALASRLSFFIWNSIPDDELLNLARSKSLRRPEVIEKQTRRMLRDPRASALVDNFGMEFLGLAELEGLDPDRAAYPEFTQVIKDQFREETRLFLRSIFANNGKVTDLVGARYTYLNENLARHYGVPNVYGPQFRRVDFKPGEGRGGVLGQGSVLLATSHPNVTSPVIRGKWVLTNLLNSPPPPPPPGIPALEAANPSGKRLTGREQMEQHRTNPVCSGCHARMDPYGFALENLSVVGKWRDRDEAGPVNAAVTLPDGAAFEGLEGLRSRLSAQEHELAEAFAGRLLGYALGRQIQGPDLAVVRQVVKKTPGYRFEDMVLQIVKSGPFQLRKVQEPS